MAKKTKKKPKKSKKSKKSGKSDLAITPFDKSVRIKQISNGYTIEQYTEKGSKEVFAKDLGSISSELKKLMK